MIPAPAADFRRSFPLFVRMPVRALFVLTAIFAWLAGGVLAEAADKVALVIGNADYANVARLQNPVNDAQDIAAALTRVGFKVIEVEDAGRARMAEAVARFSQDLRGSQVALFYYAGHGMQIDGQNYLLPVDAKIETPADARFATLNLADIQDEMAGAGRANIIVLDACRNNPFAKALSTSGRAVGERGLGRIETKGAGSLIVFSTQPDNIANDGAGRNSPFAEALAHNLATPGVEVRQMISRVRAQVLSATQQKQVPWDNSSLVGDVFLADEAQPAPAAAPPPPAEPAAAEPTAEATGEAAECEKYAQQTKPFATPDEIKAARRLRDWKRAMPFCKAASAADPGSAHLHYLLAGAYSVQKDHFNALREAKIAADAGDAAAAALVGFMYTNGLGVLKNYGVAAEYFQKSADAGNGVGYADLASLYLGGFGVTQDYAKALALLEKAVELGNAFALSEIGRIYFDGKGMPRDYAAAEQYFLQAAELGDGYAMKFLAILYERGLVGPADATRAAELRLRAQQEDAASATPAVVIVHPPAPYATRLRTSRRIVYYRWRGGGSFNPAWQAAPGDNRCCPHNMLVCPLGRHWC